MACTKNIHSNEHGHPSIHASVRTAEKSGMLLNIRFPDTFSATKYCQNRCAECGFTVKQEINHASGTIHVVFEDYANRQIELFDLVLSETDPPYWAFHVVHESQAELQLKMTGEDGQVQPAWPAEVNAMITNLTVHQQVESRDIRVMIQRHFPDLIWNERRFQQQLMEARKRQKEDGITARVNRMIHLSAQLSAVVSSSEESALNFERSLIKMLDHFSHLAHLSPDRLDSLVDLEETADESTNATKKRKSAEDDKPKGVQRVTIPGFNVHVRAQPLRSTSLSSQGSRRTSESSAMSSPSTGFPPRNALAASHDPANFALSQQVDDLINLTYHHSIHGPFSPNDAPLAPAAQPFIGAGDYWPSVKDGHRSTARFNSPSMPPTNDNPSCPDPHSNAIFF